MITIKDFKKGENAYSVLMNHGQNTEPIIREEPITTIGRTYVTTNVGSCTFRYQNHNTDYLFEKVDYGESRQLFKTRQDAENYIETRKLAQWLGSISISKAEQYSLKQLRTVKSILETKKT